MAVCGKGALSFKVSRNVNVVPIARRGNSNLFVVHTLQRASQNRLLVLQQTPRRPTTFVVERLLAP